MKNEIPQNPSDQRDEHDSGYLAQPSTLFGPRTKMLIGVLLVGSALVYFATVAFQGAAVRFQTVDGLVGSPPGTEGKLVGLAARLVPGSFSRSSDGLIARFVLRDEHGNKTMPVEYVGEIGSIFFNEHSEIIVQGHYGEDGVFDTEHLSVKCPTKYVTEQERAELTLSQGDSVTKPPYQDTLLPAETGS